MNKAKKIILVIGTIMIGAMMVIPLGTPLVTEFSTEKNITNSLSGGYTIKKGEIHPQPIPCRSVQMLGTPKPVSFFLRADAPVADTLNNEGSPSVALCSGENIIVVYDIQPDVITSGIWFSYSADMGHTWTTVERLVDGYDVDPVVAYRRIGNSAVACWTPDDSDAANIVYLMEDITDPETWSGSIWTWDDDYDMSDWHNFSIAGCHIPDYPEFWGAMSYIGDIQEENYNEFGTQCPWVLTDGARWGGEGFAYCTDFNQWNYSRTTSTSIDSSVGRGYTVFDFFNDSVGTYNLGVVHYHLETAWDDDHIWYTSEISGSFYASYAHPDISMRSGSGYIACETNENGNKDLVCFYSMDGFNTTTKTFIANSPDDETDPSVISYGDFVQCTFTKNGDLYETHSNDGGVTWSESVQINDQGGTVGRGWHNSELTSGGNVVWVDTRDGNADIYFDSIGIPAPVINIEEIRGGFGVTSILTNTGGADAENIEWSIVFDGPVFVGKEKTGTVTIPAGGESTINTGFIFGIGPASVRITVGGASKTASGFVLGPLVLGVS